MIICRSKKIPIVVSKLSMLVSYLLFLSIILEKQEKYDMQHSWHVQSQHLPIFTFVIMFGKHQLNLKSLCWYIFGNFQSLTSLHVLVRCLPDVSYGFFLLLSCTYDHHCLDPITIKIPFLESGHVWT